MADLVRVFHVIRIISMPGAHTPDGSSSALLFGFSAMGSELPSATRLSRPTTVLVTIEPATGRMISFSGFMYGVGSIGGTFPPNTFDYSFAGFGDPSEIATGGRVLLRPPGQDVSYFPVQQPYPDRRVSNANLRFGQAFSNITTGRIFNTTTDGENWTPGAFAPAGPWTVPAWSPALQKFVALSGHLYYASDSSSMPDRSRYLTVFALVSTDGVTWTKQATTWTAPGAYSGMEGGWDFVRWVPELGRFFAGRTSASGVLNEAWMAYSANGLDWTSIGPSSGFGSGGATDFAWSPTLGRWVVVCGARFSDGRNNGIVGYSTGAGLTWVNSIPRANSIWTGVVWSPALAKFVAILWDFSTSTWYIANSSDGISWTFTALDSFVTHTNSQYVAPKIVWDSVNEVFVAATFYRFGTPSGNYAYYSADGVSWTRVTLASPLPSPLLNPTPGMTYVPAWDDTVLLSGDGYSNAIAPSKVFTTDDGGQTWSMTPQTEALFTRWWVGPNDSPVWAPNQQMLLARAANVGGELPIRWDDIPNDGYTIFFTSILFINADGSPPPCVWNVEVTVLNFHNLTSCTDGSGVIYAVVNDGPPIVVGMIGPGSPSNPAEVLLSLQLCPLDDVCLFVDCFGLPCFTVPNDPENFYLPIVRVRPPTNSDFDTLPTPLPPPQPEPPVSECGVPYLFDYQIANPDVMLLTENGEVLLTESGEVLTA